MRRSAEIAALCGMVAILGIMLYSVSDVALRYLFNAPLPGAVDVVAYGLGFAVAAVMPYGFVNRDHVSVDLLPGLARGRGRLAVEAFVCLVSTACMAVLTQRIWVYALERRTVGDRMWILQIEVWPIWYAMASFFSLAVLSLAVMTLLAAADAALGPGPAVSQSAGEDVSKPQAGG
ncbi:TRAP transporter small permease [Algihabitans albus]|uniref:TRAP transporter small permease n=1 Tax=Algihabitans albus TaxID=2164067 RepID=UPI0013C2DEAB|nr:TRAP transporter small permease [Algihabitans albus]